MEIAHNKLYRKVMFDFNAKIYTTSPMFKTGTVIYSGIPIDKWIGNATTEIQSLNLKMKKMMMMMKMKTLNSKALINYFRAFANFIRLIENRLGIIDYLLCLLIRQTMSCYVNITFIGLGYRAI